MEKLKSLLIKYNITHKEDCDFAPWNKQFCDDNFPYYWVVVYEILDKLDRNKNVIEIGCGLGTVTAILCHQGYKNIISYEKSPILADLAATRMKELFGRENIIQPSEYTSDSNRHCDILIYVNCAYSNRTKTKEEYISFLYDLYKSAGEPAIFILEVIDDSYTLPNEKFPFHIRLNQNDIRKLFPSHSIECWPTYRYPINKKSKTLYLIKSL